MRGELLADFPAERLVFESFCDFRAHRAALDLLTKLRSDINKRGERDPQCSTERPYESQLNSLYDACAKQADELIVTENNKLCPGGLELTHALPKSQFDEVVTQLEEKFSQLDVSRPRVVLVDWDETLCFRGADNRVDVAGVQALNQRKGASARPWRAASVGF